MRTITAILLFVAINAMFYLIGAFYSVSLNIASWTESTRFVISVCSPFISIFATVMYLVTTDEKQ